VLQESLKLSLANEVQNYVPQILKDEALGIQSIQ
jgi:hypothetical protein